MDDRQMPAGEDRLHARAERLDREARAEAQLPFEQMSLKRLNEWIANNPPGPHEMVRQVSRRIAAHQEWHRRVVELGDPEGLVEERRLRRAELRSWAALAVAIVSVIVAVVAILL
jgi:hypothetical protein